MSGESPPPPPRTFGRDRLVEKIVGLAESLTSLALIGVGGIGKTSTALTALHDNRITKRYGDNRRFIRCDQFPTSLAHFLHRLSKVIGAPIENPEDLTSLRPSLSSRKMFIVLDNAESILDPQGMDAREIYDAVEELGQFGNICVCITSRISTVPPDFETLDIPTLSPEAAHDTFYRIYKNCERSDRINDILKQLDFHPLSITLLATVAQHNRWDADRLTEEWEIQRTDALHTHHNKSLAATIELSLASPTFQELGPDARELLGVIAFFPQGVNECNLKWLFPTFSNRTNIFDRFCLLSLTYRSNGFVTMLAPLRDHLCPKDPMSSPLLCAAKDCYFGRLSIGVYPGKPGYEETRWIEAEDVNVERLLDVFTTIDMDSNGVWDVYSYFLDHLYWHKPRLVLLRPKIEALPDVHPSKPRCLFQLSRSSYLVGNHIGCKELLIRVIELWRSRGNDLEVVRALHLLSDANRLLHLYEEGIQQATEALEICERLGDTFQRAHTLRTLAYLLYDKQQLDAAEEAASRSMHLLPLDQYLVCQCHRLFGEVHSFRRDTDRAVNHFETALRTASSFGWHDEQFWGNFCLAELYSNQGRFDDSHAHVERAKLHTTNNAYYMGRAMELHAVIWYGQGRFGEARLEALCAANAYEKVEATEDLERCRTLLRLLFDTTEEPATSGESELNGEFLDTVPPPRYINFLSKLGGPGDTIDGCLDFFGCMFPAGHHGLVLVLCHVLQCCHHPCTLSLSSSSRTFSPSCISSTRTHRPAFVVPLLFVICTLW